MAELRANPSVVGGGLYTYNQEQDSPRDIRRWADTTLREYVNDTTAPGLRRRAQPHDRKLQCGHPGHP